MPDQDAKLTALGQLLDMTDPDDWHLMHATMRQEVAAGAMSLDAEQAYKAMVDRKLAERQEDEDDDA